MICAACSQDNRDSARFCLACGAPLVRRCAACGVQLPPAARFCDACGVAVGGEAPDLAAAPLDPRSYTPRHLASKILTGRGAMEGERKQVTVLFADIANSTAIAEGLDPEDMHGIMDRCFQILLAEVHRYEGTVNQFTGDGLMALFGAPIAHENAAERAVRAALAMQGAMRRYGDELQRERGIEFRLRIGINTGPVVVGRIGDDLRMDYTAVGDTTNLAARLQTAAPAGGILVSDATARVVGERFALRALEPMALKGKSQPVVAHEVMRALPRLPLVPHSETGLTPLIGRATESASLWTAYSHAREGRGQVMVVVGEAGIGKSRLLHEFRRGLSNEDVGWLEGRCVSFGHTIPMLPIIDVVKASMGIEESDEEPAMLEKLRAGLAALGDAAKAAEPHLRALLSPSSGDSVRADASARRFALFEGIKRLLLAVAARRPLVVVLEDLHWLDPASGEFLTFIADAIPGAPILLLCTHRPGFRTGLEERSYITRVALQPLSPAETSAMTSAVLETRQFPEEIRNLIAAKADGNPFFIEEVAKSLLEMGALRRVPEGFVLDRPLAEIAIPDRIQDVIMARIDRLGEDSKHAMQVASVIGREFAVRLLQRAAELGERVDVLVGELRSLELIYEKSGVPELAYMFKHALTHDVAYASLLLQRRRRLHGIIGRAVEELYADRLPEYWETLAHHFHLAEEWKQAFTYALRAANKARSAFANREAIYFYERALEAAQHLELEGVAPANALPRSPGEGQGGGAVSPADHLAIHEGLAFARFCLSDFPGAIESFNHALEIATAPVDRGRLQVALAETLLWAHEFDDAIAATHTAEKLGVEAGDDNIIGLASFVRAYVEMVRGELEESERTAQVSFAIARKTKAEILVARNRMYRALRANWRGEYAAAIAEADILLPELRAHNELLVLVEGYSHFGIAIGGAGDYTRVLPHLEEGISLAEAIGNKVWGARLWNTTGWILGELGAFAQAEEADRRCLEFMAAMGSLRFASEFVANAEVNLADAAIWKGDFAAAEPHLDTVAAILGDRRNEWMAWRYGMHFQTSAAEWALLRGDLARARQHLEAAFAIARRTRSRRYIVRATRLLSQCHAAAGDFAGAESLVATALADAQALGNPAQLWQTALVAGRVLHNLGRDDEARVALGQGVEAIERAHAALAGDVRSALTQSPMMTSLLELAG